VPGYTLKDKLSGDEKRKNPQAGLRREPRKIGIRTLSRTYGLPPSGANRTKSKLASAESAKT